MTDRSNTPHLESLYPFLHKRKQDSQAVNRVLLNSVQQKVQSHADVVAGFFGEHGQAVIDTAGAIADSYRREGCLYTMGNGGSSCDASHLSVEFLHPVTTGRPALAAHDLTMDKSMLTAVGNDVGFANVFLRQVIALLKPRDVLIGISTSGNSENLVKAFREAQRIGAATIALTGGDGGEVSQLGLDHCLVVSSDSIHRIQECHVVIYHILWDLVHTLLADDRGNLGDLEAR
jgi:D-sedoheptulose 7-phosphate isomerase